jgi:hypothetical protein
MFEVSIRFTQAERERLEQEALRRGIPVAQLVRAQLAALMGVGGRHWPVEPMAMAPAIGRRA